MMGGQVSKVEASATSAAAAFDALLTSTAARRHAHYRRSHCLTVTSRKTHKTPASSSETFTTLLKHHTGNKGEFNPLTGLVISHNNIFRRPRSFCLFGNAFIEL